MLGAMNKPLLTVSYSGCLSRDDEEALCKAFASAGERIGAEVLVHPDGLKVALTHDPSALHERLDRLAAAIEGLVAINAALLERMPLPDEDEPQGPEDGSPQPLSPRR